MRLILVMLFFSVSVSVSAQDVNYDYIQGSYGEMDFDSTGFDLDGDGFGLSASFSVADNFHLFGEYQTAGLVAGIDLNLLELGAGYHTNISPNLDVYANLAYINVEVESGGFGSADEGGFSVGLGLRGMVSDAVELYGGLDFIDFDESDGELRSTAGFMLTLTESLGVGAKAALWDDINIYQLNVRWYFQ